MFITEHKNEDYFDFAIRERHEGNCPGDPQTTPIVDRFRVYRNTKEIRWYEPTEGEWHAYIAVKRFRNVK